MSSKLKLSSEERTAYSFYFRKADTSQIGVLTGENAVEFFAHSRLPPHLLGEIWQSADEDNKGFLTEDGFNLACRLIGYAQQGIKPTLEVAREPGPISRFDHITSIPGLPAQAPLPSAASLAAQHPLPGVAVPPTLTSQSTGTPSIRPQLTGSQPPPSPVAPQLTGSRGRGGTTGHQTTGSVGSLGISSITGGGVDWPTLTQDDRVRFGKIFNSSGPLMGLLDGDKARDIFLKSQLPVDKLGQIWNISDTRQRGRLDQADFTIAMYFISNLMSSNISTVPSVLPPGLYEQASGGGIPLTATISTTAPISPQATGIRAPPPVPPPRQPVVQEVKWDVSEQEKKNFDGFFATLDTGNKGWIEGDVAVPFFQESRLPDLVLANIWDLADIRQEGKLNREEFAVAMKLITDKLSGKEVPTVLPQSMIPPSMRTALPTQPVSPAFPIPQTFPPPPPKSTVQQDLLSLFDDPPETLEVKPAVSSPVTSMPPPVAPRTISPQHTAGSVGGIVTTNTQSYLSPQRTGGGIVRVGSPLAGSVTTSRSNDLLSEEADIPSVINEDSARLGNLKNQVASTETTLSQITSQRVDAETIAGNNSSQISDLETRLARAKAAHEAESKLLEDIRAKRVEQENQIKKLREDLIRNESALSAVKLERDEVEQNLLRDKEEVRAMKAKMGQVTDETNKLKMELEVLKKEARQQKGLLTISRKQLGAVEGDKEKVEKEIEETEKEIEETKAEIEEVQQQPTITSAPFISKSPAPAEIPLPASYPPSVASPVSTKSTNPFDRLAGFSSKPASPAPSMSPFGGLTSGSGSGSGGPSFASVFGIADAEEEKKIEQDKDLEENVVGPVSVVGGQAEEEKEEEEETVVAKGGDDDDDDDPFAVPSSSSEFPAIEPTVSQVKEEKAPATAFEDDFESAFASIPNPTSSNVEQEKEKDKSNDLSFDDAFSNFDTVPVSSSGFSSIAAPTVKEEPGKVETKKVVVDSDDEDSSDDDGGPEDAFSGAPSRGKSPLPKPLETSGKGIERPTSVSASSSGFDENFEDARTHPSTEASTFSNLSKRSELPDTTFIPRPPGSQNGLRDSPKPFEASNISLTSIGTTTPQKSEEKKLNTSIADFDSAFPAIDPPRTKSPPQSITSDSDTPIANFAAGPRPPGLSKRKTLMSRNTTLNSDGASDFDRAFSDLGSIHSVEPKGKIANSDFDDAFGFGGSSSPTSSAPGKSIRQQQQGNSAFSAFEDSFDFGGGPKFNPPSYEEPTTSQSNGSAARSPSPPQADDIPAVKQITSMGFSRSQALKALEKNNYNSTKAIESLLR